MGSKMVKYFFIAQLFLIIVAGLAGSQQQNESTTKIDGKACWSELQSAMMKMHEGMGSVPESGGCDKNFAGLMIPHHQAAIDMAKTELLYGKDPAMRRLAQEIITGQQSEIELMQLWLQKRKAGSR